jgi:hypothetical protein
MTKTAKSPWKQRMTFITPRGVAHDVCGRSLMFYPVSVDMLTELRHLAEPLAEAILVLLTRTQSDTGQQVEDVEDKKENVRTRRTTLEGLTVDLAKHRDGQRKAAMLALTNALFDDKARELVGRLIVDSLRDDFSREESQDPRTVTEFVKGGEDWPGLDARMLAEFLVGLGKANKEVLGPLGLDAARELMAKRMSELVAAGKGDSQPSPSPASSGESLPMPSSEPQPEATTSIGSAA